MKRIWIGVGLLAVLLAGGLWIAGAMENAHEPGASDLRRASELALDGDWLKAEALVERARESWEEKWRITASFSDHEPMDTIDGVFAQLKIYARAQDTVSYAAACADLAEQLRSMSQAHALNWWNLM